MSGDVFGNGMLLSDQTCLVAAFDHRHIFVDPDPDPAVGFAERKRLFALPRSSWDDYDRAKIGKGGGVFPRSQKSIRLSKEIKAALDIEADALPPHDLIRAILLAPVELFWNGGIGTYVKASSERHADAFDRANDPVRVNGSELRCKIVGEGGNLGFTQRGRIEFARQGGRINTDFIDNSAGVDCSDHEVNIKILLGAVVDAGDMTGKQRDQLLAEMTDEVAKLVLRNNILQVQAISLAEADPQALLDSQAAFMRRLEASGRLNRELELLPDEEALAERRQAGLGLYRPEIAVLLAYAKMALYDELLVSDLPDEPYLRQDLIKYFPRPLRKSYQKQIEAHRLRREITATLVANSLVNRGLGEFAGELAEQTGASAAAIARSYIVAREAFALVALTGQLEQLATQIGAQRQIALLGEVRQAIAKGTHWFLRNLSAPIDMRPGVDRFMPGIARLLSALDQVVGEERKAELTAAIEGYAALGLDHATARQCATLAYLEPACEIVVVAEQTGVEVVLAARVYFALDAALHLDQLFALLERIGARNQWDRLAINGLRDDMVEEHRRLTVVALSAGGPALGAAASPAETHRLVVEWLSGAVANFARWQRLLGDMDSRATLDLAMLSVAVRVLASLRGTAAS
jgi:glutamate dehydrogenase